MIHYNYPKKQRTIEALINNSGEVTRFPQNYRLALQNVFPKCVQRRAIGQHVTLNK